MWFPGEKLVSTAIETLSNGLIKKMDESEARRDREFTFKLKELEFYKNNYDKEIRDIFDFWFELVRITHIKDNKSITEEQRKKHKKRYETLTDVDNIAKYKMNTLKYGGTETGRVLAMQNKLRQEKYSDRPETTEMVIWCAILSVLKKDVLGQDLAPTDILQVLVNDYDAHEEEILAAQKYICEKYHQTYADYPYWAK